ncbi:MAG: hypothetical protein AAF997_00005, partial [Myxococcota bacterium]
MSRTRSLLWPGCVLVALLAGCGDAGAPGNSGSLALDLVLADGSEVDRVDWRITGNDMDPMDGSIDTSAPGSTVSLEVFGIPPGEGYLLELDATSNDGGTTCKGEMNFNVAIGQISEVFVMLQCKTTSDAGGVRVEAEVNLCGELIKVVVSPLQTSIGNDIDLSAAAVDEDGDAVSYFWSASGGSIANPNSPNTTFTCGQVGQQFVRIQVSDAEHCVDEWTVPVRCVDGGGTGGTAGSGGASGAGGGAGGTGGASCQQTCGVGNPTPSGPTDTGRLNCSVMGIPIPLDFAFTVDPEGPIAPGENVITTAFETEIPPSVVDLILALASEATVTDTFARVSTTVSPSNVDLRLTPVPCLVCFMQGQPLFIPNDPRTDAYIVEGTSAAFELSEVTVGLNASGLPLTLTNAGPDPNCSWQNNSPPLVNFGDGGTGGIGTGGTGGIGTGGTGGIGTGGTGGRVGACLNPQDTEILDDADYTNRFGQRFVGPNAVNIIARDCVLGAPTLVSDGCGQNVAQVLSDNTPENRAALGRCVDQCTADQGIGLSEACLSCYGDTVTCGAAFCPAECAADVNTPTCQACGCQANCFRDFEVCTGFLPDGSCDGFGAGGSGGAGGGTGTGGDGGSPACQTTCGLENDLPSGGTVASQDLNCEVMGIPIPLTFNFTAVADGPVQSGNNDITSAAEVVIPNDVVDLLLALADEARVLSTDGGVETSGVPARLSLLLTDTPCDVCFTRGSSIEVALDPRTETFAVSDASIDLGLADVTVVIDVAGLPLVLSNFGDAPNCVWNGAPPG